MSAVDSPKFTVVDYVVFGISLTVSAAIGVFYACTGGRQKTTKEFLLGNRKMGLFPATMSLVASFVSGISVLGVPSETYRFSTMYWITMFSMIPAMAMTAHIYIPVYHKLNLTSAYEYLEVRFNKLIRRFGIVLFIMTMFLYMAVVLYAPALALAQVTGLEVWVSVVSSGLICTFYTTIGGMKAVMWTDTFQMLVIIVGTVIVVIKGSIELGGISEAWTIASEGNRIQWFEFDPDPTIRHSFWTLIVGGAFFWMSLYATNQATVQRYLSINSLRRAQLCCWLMAPSWIIIQFIFTLVGVIMYAKYADCDPLTTKGVEKPDQLFPLFVMETLSFARGLPGLFTASVFSAALSTVSSGVNSLAAVTLVDIIKPVYMWRTHGSMRDEMATTISKLLACFYGLLTIGLAFMTSVFGNAVLTIAISLLGMVGGPVAGVFTLGIVFPCANEWGALAGLTCSLALSLWIGVGTTLAKVKPPILPMSTAGCNNTESAFTTTTTIAATLETTIAPVEEEHFGLYKISYMYYVIIAMLACCIVGVLVSVITGGNKKPLRREYILRCCYGCASELEDDIVQENEGFNKEANQVSTVISSQKEKVNYGFEKETYENHEKPRHYYQGQYENPVFEYSTHL